MPITWPARRFAALDASLVLSLLAASVWMFCASSSTASEPRRPNVLFIAVDDLNDWVSALAGHPQARTPNIDRLAKRGVLFSNCHCAAPACNPSRVALMTGIRPSSSGVYHNRDAWRQRLPNAVTLPQHFREHGYLAIGSGKIYHDRFPDPPSWDAYWPSKTQQRFADPLPKGRPLNGLPHPGHFDWGPVDATEEQMSDHRVVTWVIEQLAQRREKPVFLACGIYRPHLPWYVPEKYFAQFPLESIHLPVVLENDLEDVPPAGIAMAKPNGDHRRVVQHAQWRAAVRGYLASIALADDQVGRLIDALDASGQRDNTIVVLWTDHGWHLGEKQHWRKFALWERATRTPLIVVAPTATAGSRCDRPVNLIDVYPTLIELCKLGPRPELEGVSLVPLLADPTRTWNRPSLTTHGRNNHALRSQRYRYIRYADASEELYDHQVDPHEWHNLADDPQLDVVKQAMQRWLPKTNVP